MYSTSLASQEGASNPRRSEQTGQSSRPHPQQVAQDMEQLERIMNALETRGSVRQAGSASSARQPPEKREHSKSEGTKGRRQAGSKEGIHSTAEGDKRLKAADSQRRSQSELVHATSSLLEEVERTRLHYEQDVESLKASLARMP